MPIAAHDTYRGRVGQTIRGGKPAVVNQAPVWSGLPATLNIVQGGTLDLRPYVSDPDGDALTIALESGPAWLTLSNGVLSFAADAPLGESGDIVVSADDGYEEESPPPEPGALPTFGLTSATGGSDLPFALGHVFAQGDIPSGTFLTSDLAEFEAEPRNYWGDGSLKFAVLKGRATFAAGVKKDVVLSTTTTAPSGSNVGAVTAADVGTTTVVHSVAGTVSLADAINGADLSAFAGTAGTRPANAGKMRSIPGRVMTEEHFYAPLPGHGHLCVFWYVRKYLGGRIEIETCVEQGWARIAGPAQLDGTTTVTINGVEAYSASIEHRHHARWSRTDWIGGDPQITPSIDGAYWRATKMVPNYMPEAPSETALNALVQTVAPMERGPFDVSGGSGGYHKHIGLLPLWEAVFITSGGDARAYRALLAGEQASNACTVVNSGFVWRDEQTLQPIKHADFLHDSTSNGYSPNYGSGKIFKGTNTTAPSWANDQAHGWAAGYLAYLVTGRWFSLETVQMVCGVEFLGWGVPSGTVDAQRWMNGEDRGCAWVMRNLGCAAAVIPETIADQAAMRAAYRSHLMAGWDKWHATQISANTLGVRAGIYNYTDYAPAPYLSAAAFQQYFIAQSFAFGYQIAGHILEEVQRAKWLESAQFHCQFPVGLAGTRPGGFCFRNAANYGLAVGPDRANRTTFYADFAELYDANVIAGNIAPGADCNPGSDLLGGNFPSAQGYWGNFLPALAHAVDLAVPDAQAAWDRIVGAGNYELLRSDFASNAPQFGIEPR